MPTLPRHGILKPITHRLLSSSTSSSPQTIFSGIQPTGIPHLGNYLGALRQWVHLQNSSPPSTKLLFCVVDLHALTIKQEPAQLRQWKRETLATFIAIGLDPKRSTLFYQSDVPAHAELHWLLSTTASMGYLSRMTQWKSKLSLPTSGNGGAADGEEEEDISPLSTIARQKLKLGLFSYPVLQAADVLIHNATHIPVGEDQVQHIEFARECAGNFNALYGNGKDILVKPTAVLSPAKRIMSLKEPEKKMSKSAVDPASRILITDERDVIEKKVRQALTDSVEGVSYDIERRPGVSNLVDILTYVSGEEVRREDVLKDLEGASLKALKAKVADEIDKELSGIRERFKELAAKKELVNDVAADGASKARESASITLGRVRRAVGLD